MGRSSAGRPKGPATARRPPRLPPRRRLVEPVRGAEGPGEGRRDQRLGGRRAMGLGRARLGAESDATRGTDPHRSTTPPNSTAAVYQCAGNSTATLLPARRRARRAAGSPSCRPVRQSHGRHLDPLAGGVVVIGDPRTHRPHQDPSRIEQRRFSVQASVDALRAERSVKSAVSSRIGSLDPTPVIGGDGGGACSSRLACPTTDRRWPNSVPVGRNLDPSYRQAPPGPFPGGTAALVVTGSHRAPRATA